MAIFESLGSKIISEIGKWTAKKAWRNSMTRKDKVLRILQSVGLRGEPKPDFDSVYAHTLVQYGIEQPRLILDFFSHEDIQKAFKESFDKNDPAILHNEASALIEWNTIGDKLRNKRLDPRLEFARFTLVFNEVLDRTRTSVEVRRDHKLDEILRLIKGNDLNIIRAKNLETIQGGLAEQLKSWFRTWGIALASMMLVRMNTVNGLSGFQPDADLIKFS